MMSRFTEKAQEALQRAQQLMFSKHHTQLDVEHIFLALLQQRNSLPAQILTALGGAVENMMERLDKALNNTASFTNVHNSTVSRSTSTGYITLRANRVLQLSAEEADRLKDDFISTEHLLLAITKERGGAAGRILKEADIDESKVDGVLKDMRGSRSPDDADESIKPPQWKSRVLVNPASLPRPVGFTYGILATGYRTLYLAGQTALDADGKLVAPGDVVGQYRQVLANLRAVVDAAGGEMANIVKMTIFVQDRDDYKAHLKKLGEVHKEFFGSHYPATALLEVSRFFDDGVLVEIEAIAVIP
jgi:enamine deaminase RidA (YjgF/YER057c/UK114 family)